MARYELTIDPNYVSHWTELDALRELFQNALDESTLKSDNLMLVNRDGDTLKICTKNAILSKSSLLIGNSTKRDDGTTIGNQGEGYKLALLVLTRLGYDVVVRNYSEKETWTPKIINSKRFDSKLLVVDTEKSFWSSPPDHDLTFEINGITDEIYKQLQERVLQLRDGEPECFVGDNGTVLLDESERGKVYVNGLYVTTMEDGFRYGYNIKPTYLKLDRDRRAVNGFDLSWQAGIIWGQIDKVDIILDMSDKGYSDVKYINSTLAYNDPDNIRDSTYEEFSDNYGENALPVTTQDELEHVTSLYSNVKPVIVSQSKYDLIHSSNNFNEREYTLESKLETQSPSELLSMFYEKYSFVLSDEADGLLSKIIELSIDWE